MTSVIIPNSVTSLGGWAFSDCWGLTSVTIGSGVTSVGGAAFSGCVGLTAAHFLGNAPTMGTTVFASCGVGFTFTVLYDNSTSGWTNPWYTYPTAAFASYITSSAGPGGSISPSSEVMVLLNHDQTFTISPDTSYHVADVLVDGNSVGAVTSYTFTNVTAAHTITASFAINTHTLTVNTVGVGTVGKSPDQALYDYGTVVTLTAAPTPGYHFLSWCGATPDSVDPLKATVTMESDTTVTATFTTTIDTFPITALAGVNGTITPSGSVLVTYGASQSFTITPDLNYMIDTLTVDGVIVSNATNQLGWTVTLTNVMSSHTITVTFKSVPDVVPPTIALPDFGTITGVSGYSGGSVQIFTVSTSPFNLEFTVDDNSGSAKWTIKVNGVVVIDPVGIGLMTYPLPLVEGRNDVEISARDATGNSTSKELIIFLDSMNPVLTIAPALPVSVTNSELTITGSVVDTGSGLKHFTINGTEVIPFLDGSFSEKLLLTKGANSIILTAEDRVGHQVTTTYTVTYAAAVPTFLPAMTVTLTIGKTAMDVNGMPVTLDAAPVIQNNRTLLPIRALIETLGGTVVWDATTRTATVTLKSRTVSVTIGNPMGLVNGKKVAIDPANPKVVPLILNSRTFLPLRFIAENLGLDLAWDALTRTISFTYWP